GNRSTASAARNGPYFSRALLSVDPTAVHCVFRMDLGIYAVGPPGGVVFGYRDRLDRIASVSVLEAAVKFHCGINPLSNCARTNGERCRANWIRYATSSSNS